MWMMGYSDGGEFNVADSFNGRNLSPLVPRSTAASFSTNNSPTLNPQCLSRIHGTDLLAFNHHLANMGHEQGKRELSTQQQQQLVVSSRWNPTSEQLQTLEELYRRGTRTPSADQIQHITAQLRRYGKIEGKNVFYWFQNHKARERQKRRHQLQSTSSAEQQLCCNNVQATERKESGASRAAFEVEQTKGWAPSTNCSTLAAEKTVSIEKAAVAECRTDGWVQFDEGEILQQRGSLQLLEKNATWQMMQFPCSSPPIHHHHLLNTHIPTITTTAAISTISTTSSPETTVMAKMDPKLLNSIFIAPNREDIILYDHLLISREDDNEAAPRGESQTLQLFPLQSGDEDETVAGKSSDASGPALNSTPYQFFDFLPLKN